VCHIFHRNWVIPFHHPLSIAFPIPNPNQSTSNHRNVFREAHEGQTVRTVVGDYEFIGQIAPTSALPPGVASYSEWKEGWLKHRTDKFFGVSEDDAKKIIAGLKDQ
jgi:hypothetical protein